MSEARVRDASKAWPIFASFAGWRLARLGPDAIAGLTLAAIAIPEQMATARLAGFAPQVGFIAIIAGAVGFAVFGSSRTLSVGADSTIAPIFAGTLALVAVPGSPHYAALAAALALIVGAALALGGLFRLGWIADLLSIPVTTGFLAGVAGHIALSQAPALLGVAAPRGSFIDHLDALFRAAPHANALTLAVGFGVLALMLAGERLSPRFPAALIGVGGAALLAGVLGLEARGVSTLGGIAAATPAFGLPAVSLDDLTQIGPLALVLSLVVMVQSAATTRSFPSDASSPPDVNRDFIGVGAASALAGALGAFPLNASPPRTAAVVETGGASQLGSLICAALVLALSAFGAGLLAHVPYAALAGVLLFVAQRIVRVSVFVDVWRRSFAEFFLIIATGAAILFLPIEQGVAIGIVLSLMHGVWATTRSRLVELARIPGTSIWWPKSAAQHGETLASAIVVAWQAPLSFLNAHDFQRAVEALAASHPAARLIVIEANSLVDIDYTAGRALAAVVALLKARRIDVAIARLESVRAQAAFERLGLGEALGAGRLFQSVEEAIRALAPDDARPEERLRPAPLDRRESAP